MKEWMMLLSLSLVDNSAPQWVHLLAGAHLSSPQRKFCPPRAHGLGISGKLSDMLLFLSWNWDAVGEMPTKLILKCLSLSVLSRGKDILLRQSIWTLYFSDWSVKLWMHQWQGVTAPKPTGRCQQDSEWSRCLWPSGFACISQGSPGKQSHYMCVYLSLSHIYLSRLILRHWLTWLW